MNSTDYQFMQSLNLTRFTLEQLEQLTHKLPNYVVVNYDLLGKHIRQIDKNYPYTMPIWLLILITVLVTLMIAARVTVFFYCKCKNAPTHS